MPCGDHKGPLGLGPGTGRYFSKFYRSGRCFYNENFLSPHICGGYGFKRLYELLDYDLENFNNYDNIEKKRLLKILNNYLNQLKNIQNKIEEKINKLENLTAEK